MTEYEYLVVKKVSRFKEQQSVLDGLGKQGWKMVGVDVNLLYFARPVGVVRPGGYD